jgi:hypothetical protein
MTKLTGDHLDDPADSVDAALTNFDKYQNLKDEQQRRRDRLETATDADDFEDGDDN